MRRSAWIFLAAILLPSLALAWLAVRSARDQQVILEHQQAIIGQDVTDELAKRVQKQLDDSRSGFVDATQQLLRKSPSPQILATNFHRELRSNWKLAEVGFAVDLRGAIYSPQRRQGLVAKVFRNENDRFLGNRENVPVFALNYSPKPAAVNAKQDQGTANAVPQALQQQAQAAPQQQVTADIQTQVAPNVVILSPKEVRLMSQNAQRNVIPMNMASSQSNISSTLPAESDFRKLIGKEHSGSLARFLEDKLRLMVWYRPPAAESLVFGAQLSQANLVRDLRPLLDSPDLHRTNVNYCLALLDDRGSPVALSQPGFKADWKHPFAATEIGEALPHWEAALYLIDPQQITRSASTLKLTLASIVLTLMAAILLGGWLMAADARRQMRLAQQKTDFVSNVSHELKTPLTSIRMFADMLAEGRVTERERQSSYLRIISAESARLTRLINNVLDFARMERGAPAGERRACDLVEIVREVADTCRPHLESEGIHLALEVKAETLPVMADRDALAQVILNLLSNAEKYGGREVLLCVRQQEQAGAAGAGCVDVLDRGPGIPLKKLEAAFRPFHRLDDSLASGVSGSGLGLTLARRMARANGGDVTYSPRTGGGSCFTLTIPLSAADWAKERTTT